MPRKTQRKATAKPNSAPRPISDFLDFIFDWGHPEWVVLAVEAPVEEVAKAYASLVKAKRTWADVPVRAEKKNDSMEQLVGIAQANDCDWSVIYRLMCYPLGMDDIESADKVAQKLSAKLKARAVSFLGEDTSGAMELRLFRDGKAAGRQGWESTSDPADAAFKKLGLVVPVCFPVRDAKVVSVAVREPWGGSIRRADVVDVGEF